MQQKTFISIRSPVSAGGVRAQHPILSGRQDVLYRIRGYRLTMYNNDVGSLYQPDSGESFEFRVQFQTTLEDIEIGTGGAPQETVIDLFSAFKSWVEHTAVGVFDPGIRIETGHVAADILVPAFHLNSYVGVSTGDSSLIANIYGRVSYDIVRVSAQRRILAFQEWGIDPNVETHF